MNCRICKNKINETISLANGREFFSCVFCDFVFLNPKFLLNIEEEKARYDNHENSIENLGYVKMFEEFIAEAVTPFQTSVKTILDYGSGPGPVLAELLKRKAYQVSIYDPIYAKNEYRENSFDLITSTEVFEHFNEPLNEIKRIIALLKPKGYLSVMTKFLPEKDKFKSWFYKDDPTHVSFYSLKTFEFLARELGLTSIKNNGTNLIVLQKH